MKPRKRFCLRLTALALFAVVTLALLLAGNGRVIGAIQGPEREEIVMDGVPYHVVTNPSITAADQGRYLGIVTDGDGAVRFRVYTVKGDAEGTYRYCFWDYEGFLYQRDGASSLQGP
jgi:hypothetical protein